MDRGLRIWRMTPTAKESPLWEVSTYRGEAIVAAHDEVDARQIAPDYFRRRVEVNSLISGIQSPWASKSLVVCSVVEDRYQSEKVLPGVIYPGVRARLRHALK